MAEDLGNDEKNSPVEIPEYKERTVEYSNPEVLKKDKDYFEDSGKKELHPSKSEIKFKKIKEKIGICKNKSFFGDLNLPSGKQLSFKTKTETVPLKLLNYSSGVKCNDDKEFLYYDLDHSPTIKRGGSFFNFLAEAYLRELEKIIEKGFVKEYVEKEDNLDYLKGKLNVNQQIKNNFAEPKFYCRYFDLTIDNFCNQMLLYAGYKLEKLISRGPQQEHLNEVKYEIVNHIENLRDMITLKSVIHPEEARNVFITRKNEYYETILDISKMVINEVYYQSEGAESPLGYNYLVDMNVIFERAVYKLFSRVLESFSKRGEKTLTVEDQQRFRSIGSLVELPEYKSLKMIPDITIFEKGEPIGVIETKYKGSVSNADYYQVLTYSLFLKKLNDDFDTAILVHYTEKNTEERLNVTKGKINLKNFASRIGESSVGLKDIGLYRIRINMQESKERDFEVESLETELYNKFQKGEDDWHDLRESLFLD